MSDAAAEYEFDAVPYPTPIMPHMMPDRIRAAGMMHGFSGPDALTASVLGSVEEQHVAMASGFNSAVARTGGLIATALLGSVLASSGAALFGGFHMAMYVSADHHTAIAEIFHAGSPTFDSKVGDVPARAALNAALPAGAVAVD